MAKLTVKQINSASLKQGLTGDGGGLYIRRQNVARSWVFRYTMNGARRSKGLGPYPDVSLSEAREKAINARRMVKEGVDPVEVEALSEDTPDIDPTLSALYKTTLDGISDDLKNTKAIKSWKSPLVVHILPQLGDRDVTQFTQHTIANVLEPIWKKKPETARKALARLFIILREAKAAGVALGNLTELRADARALLRSQPKGTKMPSLPYSDVPDLYEELAVSPGNGPLALRLLILTGSRSTPVRFARIDQFDQDARVWTIPAINMKGRKGDTADFRIPLSTEAVAVVKEAIRRGTRGGFLFTGATTGKPISDMTMAKWLSKRDVPAVPHGFRSSLRTWLTEHTTAPREVSEAVLAHFVGSKVERVYQRSDYFDLRHPLMDAWAAFCTGKDFDPVAAEREVLERRLVELRGV